MEAEKTSLLNMLAASIQAVNLHDLVLEDDLAIFAQRVMQATNKDGRFNAEKVMAVATGCLPAFASEPKDGWLLYCYDYIQAQLFPSSDENVDNDESCAPAEEDEAIYGQRRVLLLAILRCLYEYELRTQPFAPTREFRLLNNDEVISKGYVPEYIHMKDWLHEHYFYEFMRIAVDVSPFDTLGHIGGVHYVATYMAKQLAKVNVPIDVALISGAALCHDIGKYGCKKNEGKRVAYLHYYYTGIFCERENLKAIGHIAANHSVWDLELENLSVESLLLIYADFRVKSNRNAEGKEVVHFYSLAEAFNVILNKLDNVDEAKKQRYQKVYAKLADFEAFMEEKGVHTKLDGNFAAEPPSVVIPKERESVLLEGKLVVDQLKYTAISHNIRLMSIFRSEDDFAALIEEARSERLWKNVRTYIAIFNEYSTYMTERQKILTLTYLYELLSSKEGDIRLSAATLMGTIVANFNDKYTKELPQGVTLPPRKVNSFTVFSQYLDMIMFPNRHYTEQLKLWIGYCLSTFVNTVLTKCSKTEQRQYLDIMENYYGQTDYHEERYIILLTALSDLYKYDCSDSLRETVRKFIEHARDSEQETLQVAALNTSRHLFDEYTDDDYFRDLLKVMKLPEDKKDFVDIEGSLFLIDLKMGTHWAQKVANIELLLRYLNPDNEAGSIMHLGMHLINLIKANESIYVRQRAGEGLLKISSLMTYSQCNELAVELFNGLKIGDPQISKYVPEFLGRMILKLPPQEFDEFISTIGGQILTVNIPLAASMVDTIGVILENFADFAHKFHQDEEANEARLLKIIYIMIRSYAHYDPELSRDAFWDIGKYLFHSSIMDLEQKDFLFIHIYKKILSMLKENKEGQLDFYSNAAVLNHIYRYIGHHEFIKGDFKFPVRRMVCFYPGTFDPFSEGHKAVAKMIRDLGFDVYLALDEFSWSKHTQPRLLRRKIMNMSVANEENIYPFPEDIPINIANPVDIHTLKNIFKDKDLYLAVGMDVVQHASAYRQPLTADSVQTVNHIIFIRDTDSTLNKKISEAEAGIKGNVIHLTLSKNFEDISSTKIRDNIDLNLDISNLIDPAAQNFIYDHNLYLREPAYKHVLEALEIDISAFKSRGVESLWPFSNRLTSNGYNTGIVGSYIERKNVSTLYIDDAGQEKAIIAYAAVHPVGTRNLLKEFNDASIAAHIRAAADGSIASIGFLYADESAGIANISQIVITEILTELIAKDYAYAVYHPVDEAGYNDSVITALKRQGFVNIAGPDATRPLYAVNMKSPVVIFRDAETVLKNPFNKDLRVQRAFGRAHNNLLGTLNKIYPGKLILSFNTSAIHNKIIRKMAHINVPNPTNPMNNKQGPYMCVPFGKALSNVSVVNTVTKALHIDKYFNRAIKGFIISQSHNYSSVDNQVKTIKSFGMPVILIDDLLHKGHRMKILIPYLEKNNVEVKEVMAGVMTGQAMDLMAEKHFTVESAYFLPTLTAWMNERDCYPFIGGDGIDNAHNYSGYDSNPTINFVLPYVNPAFIGDNDNHAVYLYSLTCLQNAAYIMRTLQEVYQEKFEKRLTLKRLGEVFTYPRIPDIDVGVKFDENLDPVRFIENDIERLVRLKWGSVGDKD